MTDLLELLKGTSPVTIIVIGALVYVLLRKLREDQKTDVSEQVRSNLGLAEGEKFNDKLNEAISDGFASAVHPLTESISHLSATIGALSNEVKGLREGLSTHGEWIADLKTRVTMLEKEKRP